MSGLESELDALMPKKFVDRDELRTAVDHSANALLENQNYHEVITIYGMGGIGKSRFLKEIRKSIFEKSPKKMELIYATLELDNDNLFHALLCIRKKIEHTCFLFDYALELLLDRCIVEKVDDDFLSHSQKNWRADLTTFLQPISPIPLPPLNAGLELLQQLKDYLIKTGSKALYKEMIQKLEVLADSSPKKLFGLLPALLGCDLDQRSSVKRLVVILDSCNGCENWLKDFLAEAKGGLFILTSREPLQIDPIPTTVYQMQEIPSTEAKKYLEEYIKNRRHRTALIPKLISITECIPLYLDLAVTLYLQCENDPVQKVINEFSFGDKESLVEAFLNHLPLEQQEAILVLAAVGVFDIDVFEHLTADLNLAISKLCYHDLCKISLVDNLNTNCTLKTFHNIFHQNVLKILPLDKKYRIFQSYLNFLSHRGLYKYQNEVLRTYFSNVLYLVVDNGFELTIHENEEILDLFFALSDQRIEFSFPSSLPNAANGTLFAFLSAMKEFHADSVRCLSELEAIRDSVDLLGKHKNSYYAVQYYSMGIMGQYKKAKDHLAKICDTLSSDSIANWYYGKLKLYLADCLMLVGDFKDAIMQFDGYYQEIEPYTGTKENDVFELQKQKGHCYRFNFLLKKAAETYSFLYSEYAKNSVMKSYCLTCLCETKCFFEPQYVLEHYQESLDTAKAVGQERSRAKIYYSLGIAYTVKRDFKKASRYIRESIRVNEECHYPSGKLFALVAKGYYSYAKSGFVPADLVKEIETLCSQLEVYGYLLLPIYLMNGKEEQISQLKNAYQWLDWDRTRKGYEELIGTLSP